MTDAPGFGLSPTYMPHVHSGEVGRTVMTQEDQPLAKGAYLSTAERAAASQAVDRTPGRVQTTREAMTDLLSEYPGVIVNVVHGLDHAYATLNRHGVQWTVTLSRSATTPAGEPS